MNKTNLVKSIYILLAFGIIAACSSTPKMEFSERDLLEYGLTITVQAPDSVEIKKVDWGVQKDVTLVGPDWYNLQIFNAQATTYKIEEILQEMKETVEAGTYFSEMTVEDPDGFIFKTQIDSLVNYDFRHIKIQGDNEYIFQGGLLGSFDRAEIEKLYEIAQAAK